MVTIVDNLRGRLASNRRRRVLQFIIIAVTFLLTTAAYPAKLPLIDAIVDEPRAVDASLLEAVDSPEHGILVLTGIPCAEHGLLGSAAQS